MMNEHLLMQCSPDLYTLFKEVDKDIPVEILNSTIRTVEDQRRFLAMGRTKTMNSMHLITPEHPFSRAVDAGPWPHVWPVEGTKDFWKDWARLYYFAGVVMQTARQMKKAGLININIRYGGDWNGNFNLKDENFFDGVHFEEAP